MSQSGVAARELVWPTWVDGHLCPPGTGRVSVEDTGFQLGCAVFETLLLRNGGVPFLSEHLTRLEEGARGAGIPWPPPWEPDRALAELVDALDDEVRPLVLRLTLTRGVPGGLPCLAFTVRAVPPVPADGVVAALTPRAKVAADALEGLKSTSRLRNVLAREAAVGQGAWEALLCTEEGDVVEGTISNLFAWFPGDGAVGESNGRLLTPALGRGCLGGIVRGQLLSALSAGGGDLPSALADLEVIEARLEPSELARAGEVILTNTTGGVIPVRQILGLWESPGAVAGGGPVTVALCELLEGLEVRSLPHA